ncbi:hypothetical protein [Saccharicrinis sp. GN24d3]|uniref:hypothetical protein n=1 Tax=Saccharicrinis sp. GN24d3 TaxID=3458416 RepID=UPI0040366022
MQKLPLGVPEILNLHRIDFIIVHTGDLEIGDYGYEHIRKDYSEMVHNESISLWKK